MGKTETALQEFDEWAATQQGVGQYTEAGAAATHAARAQVMAAAITAKRAKGQPDRHLRTVPDLHPGDISARVLLPKKPPPAPMVTAADATGSPLLRGGQVVWIYGQPKSGKSWVTLALAAATAGRSLLVCFERGDETRYRLHGMFANDKRLRKRVGVLSKVDTAEFPAMAEWLDDGGAGSLVVIDAASSSGCPIDGANVQDWIDEVLEPWRDPERTIVVVDHSPRRDDQAGRNAGAIGSQTKTAAADVQYRIDADDSDAVGRLVTATLTDTGSNARWHPRAIGLAVRNSVPVAVAQETARLISEEDAYQAVRDGTLTETAAARKCGMKRTTFQGRMQKWSGTPSGT